MTLAALGGKEMQQQLCEAAAVSTCASLMAMDTEESDEVAKFEDKSFSERISCDSCACDVLDLRSEAAKVKVSNATRARSTSPSRAHRLPILPGRQVHK